MQVICPCKINLTLAITGKREDGYHLLRSAMQSLSLADKLTIEKNQVGVLRLSGPAHIPLDETNLVHRAATALLQKAGETDFGYDITIEKHIPIQAGLGGGSSDAAGTLIAFQQLLGSPLSQEELAALALTLGADVPFFLIGGTVMAEGVGELLQPLPHLSECMVVLAKPERGMSTPQCFAAFDALPTPPPWSDTPLLTALEKGDLPGVGSSLFNHLEGAPALSESRGLEQLLLNAGALGACLSGSGSAVFGLFEDYRNAQEAIAVLKNAGYWCAVSHSVLYGAFVLIEEPVQQSPISNQQPKEQEYSGLSVIV